MLKIKNILLVAILFCLAFSVFWQNPEAQAAARRVQRAATPAAPAKPSAPAAKDVPTRITSEKMVYTADRQQIVFSGNVKVVRPDFTLTSAQLNVYLAGGGATAPTDSLGLDGSKVDKIVAEKNVRIKMEGERQGECEKATYTMKNSAIVMEGNPVLSEGKNVVRGEKITFFTRENRMAIDGRVAVDFVTEDKPLLEEKNK